MNNELKEYTLDDLKLTREQFESWLNALRSGKYPQSRDTLRSCHGYCSLGVLADIQLVKAGEHKWIQLSLAHPHGGWGLQDSRWVLQGPVLMTANSIPETVIDCDLQNVLIDWNDENKLSFQQIADELEAHFMPLFKAGSN